MSTPPIPMPLRAAAGLAAVAIDEARRLPRRLVGLPVLAVSTALQASLKVQQQYAELVNRGDHLLGQLQGQDEGTPPWARFDEDEVLADDPLAPGPDVAVRPRPPADPNGGPVGGLSRLDALAEAEAADLLADADAVLAAGAAGDRAQAAADAADRLDPEGLDPEGLDPAALDPAALDVDGPDPVGVGSSQRADPTAADPDGWDAEPAGAEELQADADLLAAAEGQPPLDAAIGGVDTAALPLAGYDQLTIAQLRARLRQLSEADLEGLLAYERAHGERAPFLTMLENRLTTIRDR